MTLEARKIISRMPAETIWNFLRDTSRVRYEFDTKVFNIKVGSRLYFTNFSPGTFFNLKYHLLLSSYETLNMAKVGDKLPSGKLQEGDPQTYTEITDVMKTGYIIGIPGQ